LLLNCAAILFFPTPDTLDELLTSEVAALFALAGELALDHHLGCDAGVVSAWEPERNIAEHAMPAHDDVHLRLIEHVAHVQTAGNIRRRQQQGKNWVRVARSRCRSRKELFLHPVFGPPRLDGRGLVRL